MTPPPISRNPFFSLQKEEEPHPLPSQPSLAEALTDDSGLVLYAHMLSGQVQKQLSSLSFSGQKMRAEGAKSFMQLQTVTSPVKANDDLQELKASVSASSLPKVPSFSERKMSMEERKARMAQCMQSDDPSLSLCSVHLTKDLTRKEAGEVLEAGQRAIVGRGANEFAVPFAALSTAMNAAEFFPAMKVAFKASTAVKNVVFKAVFNKDPEAVKEAIPKWVLKAGEKLEEMDAALHHFDDYMAKTYYTVPGLMYAGAEGVIDVGIGLATGTVVAVGKKAITATKSMFQTVKNAAEVGKFTKILSEAVPGEVAAEGSIPLRSRMKTVVSQLKDYPSEQAFVDTMAQSRGVPLSLKNVTEVLPKIAQGRSGSSIYFVQQGEKNAHLVLKNFPALDAPNSRFGQELIAHNTMKGLGLTYFELPHLYKVGKLQDGYGLIMMSRAKGESLVELLDGIGRLPRGSAERSERLTQLLPGVNKTGKGVGETHRKGPSGKSPPSPQLIESDSRMLADWFMTAKKEGYPFTFGDQEIVGVIDRFYLNPGEARIAHGDVHFQNFIYDAESSRLTAIDAGSLAKSLDSHGQPVGTAAQDLSGMRITSEYFGRRTGLTEDEISLLNQSFLDGYAAECSLGIHTQEALDFYECYFNLFVLNCNPLEKHEAMKFVENLNRFFLREAAPVLPALPPPVSETLISRFIKDESGGIKLPSKPTIEKLPPDCPPHLLQFLHRAEVTVITRSKLGESAKGRLDAKILYVPFTSPEGPSALYLIRTTGIAFPGLYEKFGVVGITSSYLTASERLNIILTSLFEHSEASGYKRVFVTASDQMPLISTMTTRAEKLVATGTFSQGRLEKPLSLIEVDIGHSLNRAAAKVDVLKKPWAHEKLLEMSPDRQTIDLLEQSQGSMKTYSVLELERKQLAVRDGYLFQGNSRESLNTNEVMNYVMLRDGTIRVDFKKHVDGMQSYHSSLIHQENPIAAGEIGFWEGRVSFLNEKSGHYAPTNRVQYVEEELRSQGAQFTKDFNK